MPEWASRCVNSDVRPPKRKARGLSSRSYSHRSLVKKEAVVGGLGPVMAPLGSVLPLNSGLMGPTLAVSRLGCAVETPGNLVTVPAGLDEVAVWAAVRWPEEAEGGLAGSDFRPFLPRLRRRLAGSEEAFQTTFPGAVGVLSPGICLMSCTGREEEVLLGLLAPAALTNGLAEPPVAGEGRVLDGFVVFSAESPEGGGRVYDDGWFLTGLSREEALEAVEAAPAGSLAGLAAAAGA